MHPRDGARPPGPLRVWDIPRLERLARALPASEQRRVDVEVETRGLVSGDALLLRQLVDNVVENALKFSDAGAVRVSLRETAQATLLDVQDEGPGIAHEDSMRVFEPFYRAAGARASKPGHGIGLSLVALVARAHRTHVTFLPSSRGAHLRVSFPHA